jgi:hypothetical protein
MELSLYRSCFDNTGLPESVCETFTDLNDPARGELVHNIFMDKVPNDTNQGSPSQGDYCALPFFGNVGVPFMATLYITGLNVGLPVWLGTIPNVSNALDASQLSTLFHGHHVDAPSSEKSSPPSPTFGESTFTTNRKPKRSRKRKNRKNKSPAPTSHAGGKSLVTNSNIGNRSVASVSDVINPSPTSASHVGDVQPVIASHVGGIDSIEKPRQIGRKPKLPCNLCKGDHLTHMCLGILEVQILWSLSTNSSDFESSKVSSQPIQPLVEKVVMPM